MNDCKESRIISIVSEKWSNSEHLRGHQSISSAMSPLEVILIRICYNYQIIKRFRTKQMSDKIEISNYDDVKEYLRSTAKRDKTSKSRQKQISTNNTLTESHAKTYIREIADDELLCRSIPFCRATRKSNNTQCRNNWNVSQPIISRKDVRQC